MMNHNFDIYKFPAGGLLPTQENLTFKGVNANFGDYVAPDFSIIAPAAAFAQKTANDRLDALLKQRQTLIDEIKLDKKYENITGQFRGQLESLIDQAAQSQLSDNANFTKFNTGLMKIKNDVVLQKALKSTENAKAYADWRTKNPNALDKAYLNGGNEDNFQRWQKGETDEFIMEPTYVEPNWQEDLFKIAKDIPDTEKEIFRQLGSAVYQEKTKGKKAEDIKAIMNNHVNYLLTSDPKTAPHFKRMMQFGYDPLPEIQKIINSAADQYKNESVTLSNMQRSPQDVSAADWARISIAQQNANESGSESSDESRKSKAKGLTALKVEGAVPGIDNQYRIKNGNDDLTDSYITQISKFRNIPEGEILIQNVDLNTGKIGFIQKKFNESGKEVLINHTPISFPFLVKQTSAKTTQQPPSNPPAKPPVKANITQEQFNSKWSTLKPGQKLVGPNGVTYIKK